MSNTYQNINPVYSTSQTFPPLTLESFLTLDNDPTHNRKLSKTIATMFKIRDKFIESTESRNDN